MLYRSDYADKEIVFCDNAPNKWSTILNVTIGKKTIDTPIISPNEDFVEWSKGNYKGIFAFEPNAKMIDTCKKTFSNPKFHDVALINKGAWSKPDTLKFQENSGIFMGGARVCESGKVSIETDSIDNVLQGEKVTFIKMDIEGSEREALIGACKTIQKDKPKLALSIYHKPEDILEIPHIIYTYNNNYKFAIRQYASNMFETILYAWE